VGTVRKEFRDLAAPEALREAVASLDLRPADESVPLREAGGRVLAERIDAGIDVPGFDRAAVDGYAVRAADTVGADGADPAVLTYAGRVEAGERPGVAVDPGEAVEVSTGAVVPGGADAVVMVEDTDRQGGSAESPDAEGADQPPVAVRTALAPGDGISYAGEDVAAGERALGPGTVLTPREIGLLAAVGIDEVPVRGRPRVGIVSTGDELVRPGDPLDHDAGQIHDVNAYSVAAGVEDAGGEPVLYPHAGDDYDAMEEQLRTAAGECDLVLSSGSTSASAVDVVYRVVEDTGELLLHGVSVKPGKPTLVGRLGGAAYVGLPGYPVSALTIFRTFVAPAIRAAAGLDDGVGVGAGTETGTGVGGRSATTIEGRMAVRERYAEGRTRLVPVGLVEAGPGETLDGEEVIDAGGETLVYPVDRGSGATTSLANADGVVEQPADVAYLARGERVTVDLFATGTRPPAVVGAGEDDPALSRLLDRIERPRYLSEGTRPGLRRLRDGVTDVAVLSGPVDDDVDARRLGGWRREWGLVVPAGNPAGIEGLDDLVERDLRFVNRTTASGLRTTLGEAVADLADERETTRHDLVERIEGFGAGTRAHESPARRVRDGDADAGLGLRVTAERLDLGFVSLGVEPVRVLAAPARAEKEGVRALADAVVGAGAGDVLDALPGYSPSE